MTFDSTRNHLSIFDRLCRSLPADTQSAPALRAWQNAARETLWRLLAQDQFESCPPVFAQIEETPLENGLLREKYLIRTEPDCWMPFYLLASPRAKAPMPAVILLPHGGAGKFETIWSDDFQAFHAMEDARARARVESEWAFAFALARRGYMVVSPDLRGMGERREDMHQGEENFFRDSVAPVSHVLLAMGASYAGAAVWEMLRLQEFLCRRKGAAGVAIGGARAAGAIALLCACAHETAFCAAFVQDWFAGFRNGALVTGLDTDAAYVPGLWREFECGDLAALAAPKPLLLLAAKDDAHNGPLGEENVRAQAEIAQSAYAYGGEMRLAWRAEPREDASPQILEFFKDHFPVRV